jgi:hypothetical protein
MRFTQIAGHRLRLGRRHRIPATGYSFSLEIDQLRLVRFLPIRGKVDLDIPCSREDYQDYNVNMDYCDREPYYQSLPDQGRLST